MEVKHEVEFAHAAKVLVEHLNEKVDELKDTEVVVSLVDAECEVEACVAPINNLVISELDEIRHFRVAPDDKAVRFSLNARALVLVVGNIPP